MNQTDCITLTLCRAHGTPYLACNNGSFRFREGQRVLISYTDPRTRRPSDTVAEVLLDSVHVCPDSHLCRFLFEACDLDDAVVTCRLHPVSSPPPVCRTPGERFASSHPSGTMPPDPAKEKEVSV